MGVDDGDEDRECGRCHETMHIPPGAEPSEFCHDCAHSLVDELRARVAELEADAERLNWLQANPRLSTIRLAGESDRECYMYAVAGAPGLKLREIIDAVRLSGNKTASLD